MSKMGLTGLKSRCWQGYAPSGSSREEAVPSLPSSKTALPSAPIVISLSLAVIFLPLFYL